MSSGPFIRYPDWPERLQAELTVSKPFRYGRRDCCLFAANCVRAMTGDDPAKPWRSYKTKREAFEIVKKAGGIDKLVAEGLTGCEEIKPSRAQRGDIVVLKLPDDGGMPAGVIGLDGTPWIVGPDGLARSSPRALVTRAWRI